LWQVRETLLILTEVGKQKLITFHYELFFGIIYMKDQVIPVQFSAIEDHKLRNYKQMLKLFYHSSIRLSTSIICVKKKRGIVYLV
jgi:hypothetical protein